MPVVDLQQLKAALGREQRLLGLDVGSKTIGLALSDVRRTVASPHSTIRRAKFARDVKTLVGLVTEQDIGGLVIGLPVSMDGREGPRCQSVRQFAANLAARIERPMLMWDERLSTAAVRRLLTDEADLSRARRAEVVDKMAAAYILQGALDALGRA